jgi:hypothetical protein
MYTLSLCACLFLVLCTLVKPYTFQDVSAPDNGITFEPTVSSGFPLVMRMVNGSSFDTTPGTYACTIGTPPNNVYLPATVWSNDPSVLQCSYISLRWGSSMSVALYGGANYSVLLASWPSALNAVGVQPTNQYTAITLNTQVSIVNESLNLIYTITPISCSPKPCFPGLSTSVWYVCAWEIYTVVDPFTPLIPENGITNFTVTSPTTGFCPTPAFVSFLSQVDVPFSVHVNLIAYDGSFDSSTCDSVGTCNRQWTFWENIVGSYSPTAFPCIENSDVINITVTSATGGPFQTQMSLSGNALDYSGSTPPVTFSPSLTSATLSYSCNNDGQGDNSTVTMQITAFEANTLATTYTLFTGNFTQVNVIVNSLNPTSGPPGTVVTVYGTFWPLYPHICVFGGTQVNANTISSTQLTCAAPSSSDGSGNFYVLENGEQTAESSSLQFTITQAPSTSPTSTSPTSTSQSSITSYSVSVCLGLSLFLLMALVF